MHDKSFYFGTFWRSVFGLIFMHREKDINSCAWGLSGWTRKVSQGLWQAMPYSWISPVWVFVLIRHQVPSSPLSPPLSCQLLEGSLNLSLGISFPHCSKVVYFLRSLWTDNKHMLSFVFPVYYFSSLLSPFCLSLFVLVSSCCSPGSSCNPSLSHTLSRPTVLGNYKDKALASGNSVLRWYLEKTKTDFGRSYQTKLQRQIWSFPIRYMVWRWPESVPVARVLESWPLCSLVETFTR